MSAQENERLKKAIVEVVQAQIRDRQPPETKATMDRLLAEGVSEQEAMKLIGYVVASEVFAVLRQGRKYDEKRYVQALKNLPRGPWDNQ